MNSSALASSSSKKKNEEDEDGDCKLSTFAKAAGVVAGIALVGAGIAGLFSGGGLFSDASAEAESNKHTREAFEDNRTDENRFISEKITADGKKWVRWVPPPKSWVKINTDGASQGNPGPAGAGVLIRDSSGAWLVGCKKALGRRGGTEAELMAIQEGLQLAWDEGYTSVWLVTDSEPALDHINGMVKQYISEDLQSVIYNINKLKGRDWDCKLSHFYREANKCADTLANMGIRGGSYLPIRLPPEELRKHLQTDKEGVWYPRR